jgi:hypothetical protein
VWGTVQDEEYPSTYEGRDYEEESHEGKYPGLFRLTDLRLSDFVVQRKQGLPDGSMKDKGDFLLLVPDLPLNRNAYVDIIEQNQTVSPITIGMHVFIHVNGLG